MSKKQRVGLGVGGSSLLMVFIIVCLTTFATLSLLSANSDYKLSAKTAQSVSDYYAADGRATERLQQIDALILSGQAEEIVRLGLAEQTIDGYTYSEAINNSQSLQVTLRMQNNRCTVASWQVENTGQWHGGEQLLDIWDGQ